jgi:hypothetical protein
VTARFPVDGVVDVGAEGVLVAGEDEVVAGWLVVEEVLVDWLAVDEQPARAIAHNAATANDLLRATGSPLSVFGAAYLVLQLTSQ